MVGALVDGEFGEIPIVDLGPWWGGADDRAALARELDEICHQIGFFVLVGHGVAPSVTDDVFGLMETFFRLPLDHKQLIDKRRSRHFRGWEPEGSEYTNNRPDIREQIDLWSEHEPRPVDISPGYLRLLGPNQWLPPEIVPDFRRVTERWFDELGKLADELMGAMSVALGLAEHEIERRFGSERMSLTKLIHYPPTPEGQAGVNAHHDAGFLTVLAPGPTPGLEVQNAAGDWIPVPTVPGSFVINLGEMLQGMTGNYYVATPHRVITGEERFSAGYFHGPSLDTTLDPLPLGPRLVEAVALSERHSGAGYMALREETEAGVDDMASSHKPAVYGEQLWNYFARSYPEVMAAHYPDG